MNDITNWSDLSKIPGELGREDRQYGWQGIFGHLLQKCTIIDIGAGLGHSKSRLEAGGNIVTLQDIGPNLPVDITLDVTDIETDSYDAVTAFDVIEHVTDDATFLNHLLRVARKWVIITTPNFNISKCKNPYHFREYTPKHLIELVGSYRICLLMTGRDMMHQMYSIENFLLHNEPSQAVVLDARK